MLNLKIMEEKNEKKFFKGVSKNEKNLSVFVSALCFCRTFHVRGNMHD